MLKSYTVLYVQSKISNNVIYHFVVFISLHQNWDPQVYPERFVKLACLPNGDSIELHLKWSNNLENGFGQSVLQSPSSGGLCTQEDVRCYLLLFFDIWTETWQDLLYTRKIHSIPMLIQTNNESKRDVNVVIVPFLSSPSFQQVVNQELHESDVISLHLVGQQRGFFHH